MFTKTGLLELHATMHERLDLVLRHTSSVPEESQRKSIEGFGRPSIQEQLVHVLMCEEGWVHDLQYLPFEGWGREDNLTIADLMAHRGRIEAETRAYVNSLSDEQLNTVLAKRPVDWGGELRSPAFILLHVITHAFHHKGQIVAMLRLVGHPAPDTDLQQV